MTDWLYNVDVEDVLEVLDLDYTLGRGDELRIACPFHDGTHFSFSINAESTAFHCHVCKAGGTAVDLVAHMSRVSPLVAARWLKERYQPGFINPDARNTVEEIRKFLARQERPEPEQPMLAESELERFDVNWPEAWMAWCTPGWESFPACDYLFERGFEPETLEDWEFGWDSYSHRITFAVRDVSGQLIGFKGRATDGRRPKYRVLGDAAKSRPFYGWRPYLVSRVVYGAHRVVSSCRELIIVEGEWNAIAIRTKLDRPAVAINGSNFTAVQARIIRDLTERAIVFLDSDDAGHMATWGWTDDRGHDHPGIVEQLKPHLSVHVVPEHEGDPMDLSVAELGTNISESQPWTIAALA